MALPVVLRVFSRLEKFHCFIMHVFLFSKNYFEELVSVRDKQLSRIQLELTSLGEEREKERAELEVVILELQQQL